MTNNDLFSGFRFTLWGARCKLSTRGIKLVLMCEAMLLLTAQSSLLTSLPQVFSSRYLGPQEPCGCIASRLWLWKWLTNCCTIHVAESKLGSQHTGIILYQFWPPLPYSFFLNSYCGSGFILLTVNDSAEHLCCCCYQVWKWWLWWKTNQKLQIYGEGGRTYSLFQQFSVKINVLRVRIFLQSYVDPNKIFKSSVFLSKVKLETIILRN